MKDVNAPLFLTGFMGAGKTTIGRRLAERIGCEFVDLDQLLVERAGKSIPRIFEEDGEEVFRQLETAVLRQLPADRTVVYATGGGIVMKALNRDLMSRLGRVVFLRARWDTLDARLVDDGSRPLLATPAGRLAARQLLEQRTPRYLEADLVVDTDDQSVEEVVDQILQSLEGRVQ